LSAPNKLLIRCAWAGTAAFASAGYGLNWAPGTCPATFTTKASLQTAVQAFNANPTAATATYGPIADWDVSAITDMSSLFKDDNDSYYDESDELGSLEGFNADISGWDTSSVTDMSYMFYVRSARALGPQALSRTFPVHASCVPPPNPTGPPPPGSHLSPPASHDLPSTR
jgi:surface protein